MAAYNDYKTTQTLGFDSIPYDWDIKKVKYLFSIGRGRVIAQEELMVDGLYPVYSSQTQNNGCLGYINSFDFDCDQLTWTTDGANAGTIFIRSGKHNCTNVCGTLQLKSSLTSLNFIYYALQYAAQFYKRPDTNGAKIMNNEMAEIGLATPSILEQQKIIEFLDHETAQIDTLIYKQQTLIHLLKEKRQAVISHAVTKGLNPDAPMKDSGVEWLGEVPEHWEVSKLKYYSSIQGGYAFSSDSFTEEGVQILKIGNVYQNRLALERQPTFVPEVMLEALPDFIVKDGDILMSLTGTLGKRDYGFAVAIKDDGKYLLNQRVAKLNPADEKIDRDFLLNVLWSESYLNQLYSLPSGTKQANLSNSDVLDIVITLPPSKTEQKEIAVELQNQKDIFDKAIQKAMTSIELMQERRTALISAAVTGKIDVRGWRASE